MTLFSRASVEVLIYSILTILYNNLDRVVSIAINQS
jgi:hypothetical protein